MSHSYVLSCCSTVDLPPQYFDERDLPYVCFHYQLNGVEYQDDLGKTVNFAEFYQKMADGATTSTSQVNVNEYMKFFEPFLREGKDILHLSFSSGLSGSYQSAQIARERLAEQYPERKIVVVDTLAASSGYGLLVDAAYEQKCAGASIEELTAWVEKKRDHVQHWFFSTDLTYYYRGGRISKTSAVFGTILNICPLLNVSKEGKLISQEKLRGKKKVTERMLEKMKQLADGGTAYNGKCMISNSACEEDARTLAKMIEETFPQLNGSVMINSIGTVIGSHTGPGTVALFFFGAEKE